MAKWKIDPDHSVAAFKVRHLMVSYVRGQFNKLSGTIIHDQNDPAGFSLELAIDALGLHTGIAKRDDHLKSPDFFDMATNPAIIFKSKSFQPEGNGGKLGGDLTIHGITKPVTMNLTFSGPIESPEDFGGEIALGITASAAINREDFGMTWNVPLDGGGVMVGKEIFIDLDIEADLKEIG